MANLAQDKFIGRVSASTGVPETATITAAARTVLDDATVGAMVDTLGGASASGTGGLVRTTSAALVTPDIGVATGTSVALTAANSFPTVGNVATAGTGVFATRAFYNSGAKTAAITTTTVYTPAADGYYLVSLTFMLTVAASGGTVTCTMTYTGAENSATYTAASTSAAITTAKAYTPNALAGAPVFLKGGSPFQFALAFNSVTGSPTYYMYIVLTQVG
jgi:hypothetical protein